MKERILKTNNDDGEYLKYRKDLKKFYENETLEYLKSEKLRIEVRYGKTENRMMCRCRH